MQQFTIILEQDVPTPVMRSLAKYLKSQGYQIPDEINGGGLLTIQGPESVKLLDNVLQNYIGSASVQSVREDET